MITPAPHATRIHWRPVLICSSTSTVVALAILLTIGSGAATGVLYPFVGQQAFIALSGAGVGITSLLLLIPIAIIAVLTRRRSHPPAMPGGNFGGSNFGGGIGNSGGSGGNASYGVGHGGAPPRSNRGEADSSSESDKEEEKQPARRTSHQQVQRTASQYEEYDPAKWGDVDPRLRGFQPYDEDRWNAAAASLETTPSDASTKKEAAEAAAIISLHQIHTVSLGGRWVRIGEYHCLSGLVIYYNLGNLGDEEAKKPPRICSGGENDMTMGGMNISLDKKEGNDVKTGAILLSDFRLYDLTTEQGISTDYDTLQDQLFRADLGNSPYNRLPFTQQDQDGFRAVKQHLGMG